MEPEGVVEIKFRLKDQIKCMLRSDAIYAKLKKELVALENGTAEAKAAKEAELIGRENFLAPMYHQVISSV